MLGARAEVEAARMPRVEDGKPKFDIGKLCSSPLVQSVYAETLRSRLALMVTRTPDRENFHIDDWVFPKGKVIAAIESICGHEPCNMKCRHTRRPSLT